MLNHKFNSNPSKNYKYRQNQKKQKRYSKSKHDYRSLLITALFTSSSLLPIFPVLAASPSPGTVIDNQATGSFTDPNDGSQKLIESNTVTVTVAEVAGISISLNAAIEEAPSGVDGAGANQGNNEINPEDVIYFTYKITNVGNDPTQFLIPDAPSSVSNGSFNASSYGDIQIIEYDADGSSAVDLTGNNITVTNGGATTGALLNGVANTNDGSVLPGGSITIRVPIKVDAGLSDGDKVTVVMGDTAPNDNSAATQNQVYSVGTNDIYTEDNPDGTTGETDGTPINGDATNHRQEASYSQEATVAIASNTISGTVFEDFGAGTTGNNIPEPEENGLGNITLTLYKDDGDNVFNATNDTLITTTTSNSADGTYSLNVNSDGKYFVVLDHLDSDAPNTSTALPDRTVREVNVVGTNVTGQDFPYDNLGTNFQIAGACNPTAFLFQKNPTEAYAVNLITGNISPDPSGAGNNLTEPNADPFINAVGYSIVDDYIYGVYRNQTNGTIVRVNANYEVTLLGPIPGLSGNRAVGDVSADGKLYVTTPNNSTFNVIDVNPNSPTYLQLLETVNRTGLNNHDWAFNPIDNQLYTIATNHNLYRINPVTGATEDLGSIGVSGTSPFGAVYMDASGFFYASENNTGKLYRIDIRNPGALSASNPIDANTMVVEMWDGPNSSQNDGARCFNAPLPIDFGDVPDTSTGNGSGNYNTLLSDDGARHAVNGSTYLGSGVSIDTDGFVDGIDNNNNATDDSNDDGVQLGTVSLQGQSLTQGSTVSLNITASGAGVLNAWIDWNGNGSFADPGEQIATDADISGGTLNVNVPPDATLGITYARFRYSSDTGLEPTGIASDGEVEDYQVAIAAPVASNPNVLLVKRITAINGNSANNPNDNTPLNTFVDDTTSSKKDDDNNSNWPSNYLIGAIDGGKVKPGEEVEYTIYFLSTGDNTANNVLMCDFVPENLIFLPAAYNTSPAAATATLAGADRGIVHSYNSNTVSTSGIQDGDVAQYFPPGIEPSTVYANIDCDGDPNTNIPNTNGAVVVNLGDLPHATTPGQSNSYGFVRFRGKVK